jgi:hypothetical protein
MAQKTTVDPATRISRDDLESKFRDLQQGVQTSVDSRKKTIATGLAVGGVLLLVVIFLLGKRSGKRKRTFVEIRRL